MKPTDNKQTNESVQQCSTHHAKILPLKKGQCQNLNPTKEPLSSEKLKTFKGLEHLTDEQAKEMIFAIQTFCDILYEYMSEQSVSIPISAQTNESPTHETEDDASKKTNPLKRAA
jgi:hypothetical protein